MYLPFILCGESLQFGKNLAAIEEVAFFLEPFWPSIWRSWEAILFASYYNQVLYEYWK